MREYKKSKGLTAPETECGIFTPENPLPPSGSLVSRKVTRRIAGGISFSLILLNKVQMNRTAHIIPDGELLQLSASQSTSLQGELNASTMSTLQIKNDLFTPFVRRTRMQGLRKYVAKNDFSYKTIARELVLSVKEAMWVFIWMKCIHTHTVSILRYLPRSHYECRYSLSEVIKLLFPGVWSGFRRLSWS